MKYRISLQYESPMPDGRDVQTALTDEAYTKGALFYGQYGRAIVTRCVPVHDANRVGKNHGFPQLRRNP